MTEPTCQWCGDPLSKGRHHPGIMVCDATRDRGCAGCIVRDKENAVLQERLRALRSLLAEFAAVPPGHERCTPEKCSYADRAEAIRAALKETEETDG